jgi:hypothetical protein
VRDYLYRGKPATLDADEHYYLDTEKDFGYIIELGNGGRIWDAPESPAPITRIRGLFKGPSSIAFQGRMPYRQTAA